MSDNDKPIKMAKEDLLYIRRYIAEKHGIELTPQQLLERLNKASNVELVDMPGLVSFIKRKLS